MSPHKQDVRDILSWAKRCWSSRYPILLQSAQTLETAQALPGCHAAMSQGNRIPTQGSSYSTDTAMLTVGSKEAASMDFCCPALVNNRT